MIESFYTIIAFLALNMIFIKIVLFLIKHILAYFNNINFKYFGKWAIVTYSTESIGTEYIINLAKNGMNIVLIGNSYEKLQKLSEEIKQEYSIITKIIVIDFTKDAISNEEKIFEEIYNLDIGVLVNNIRNINFPPDYFLNINNRDNFNMISSNVFSLISMCKIVLPIMIHKEKGLIINISSSTALFPTPMLTVYGATNAFIEKFSADLYTEYSSKGIIIQCILPGYISKKINYNLFYPSAKNFVNSSIKTIGIFSRTEGYFPHIVFPGMLYRFGNLTKPFIRCFVLFFMKNSINKRNSVKKTI